MIGIECISRRPYLPLRRRPKRLKCGRFTMVRPSAATRNRTVRLHCFTLTTFLAVLLFAPLAALHADTPKPEAVGGFTTASQLEEFLGEPLFIPMQRVWEKRGGGTCSFDGGRTWPVKRLVHDGPGAYSTLAVGRAGTPSQGKIYLLFEGGPKSWDKAVQLAVFNLSWLLDGRDIGTLLGTDRSSSPTALEK